MQRRGSGFGRSGILVLDGSGKVYPEPIEFGKHSVSGFGFKYGSYFFDGKKVPVPGTERFRIQAESGPEINKKSRIRIRNTVDSQH
jgi:hypothetical protein